MGIFYAFGYVHANQIEILRPTEEVYTLIDQASETWIAALLMAALGSPVWVFVGRKVTSWMVGTLADLPQEMPVLLMKEQKWLDWALILGWSIACLAVMQCWGISLAGLAAALLCGGLLTLARIDLQTGLLPDVLTLSWMWLGMLFHLSGGWISLQASVAGAALGYCLLWSIFTLYKWKTGREGMGYGDFKLTAALGAWLGVQALPSLVLYASVAGALVGLCAQRSNRMPVACAIPFGPFLALAGILILFRDYAPTG